MNHLPEAYVANNQTLVNPFSFGTCWYSAPCEIGFRKEAVIMESSLKRGRMIIEVENYRQNGIYIIYQMLLL